MTDEEMAEKYAKGNMHYEIAKRENGADYAKEVSSVTISQAYLAGLKAGRETEREYVKNNAFTSMKEQGLFPFGKWHKVADGDYPPLEKDGFSINIFTDRGEIAYYNHDFDYWIAEPASVEIDPPVAWCEIPTFTDKE